MAKKTKKASTKRQTYDIQTFQVMSKSNTVYSDNYRLIAKDNEFITIHDINEIYTELRNEGINMNNVLVVVQSAQGKISSLKSMNDDPEELYLDNDNYYRKYEGKERGKFDEFTYVEFIILTKKGK